MVEQALRELVEVVVALAALEQVAEDHRVGDGPASSTPARVEGQHVILDILADLLDVGSARIGRRAASVAAASSSRDPAGPRTGR